MSERLSAERLDAYRHCVLDEEAPSCGSCAAQGWCIFDEPLKHVVGWFLDHIDARDAEYKQLQYTEEMNGEIIGALRAENERLTRENANLTERLTHSLLVSEIDALTAEIERLNAAIWVQLDCGEAGPGCEVRTCKARWLCEQITEGWTP